MDPTHFKVLKVLYFGITEYDERAPWFQFKVGSCRVKQDGQLMVFTRHARPLPEMTIYQTYAPNDSLIIRSDSEIHLPVFCIWFWGGGEWLEC